ncbi:MAG: hypothetical protein GY913_21440 [Proteobacteria bacterium]|nr:hypothetical protein [Actinomycetes bacterium]MCP4919473.1 hypothetical protein [Pseudomonadota bacterium]
MAAGLSVLTDGATTAAADLNDRLDTLEEWVNFGMASGDIQSGSGSEWVRPSHVYRPDFYGSPDNRSVSEGSTTHWRRTADDLFDRSIHSQDLETGTTSDDEGWMTIMGSAISLRVVEASKITEILFTCYPFESGGTESSATWLPMEVRCGEIALFIDGTKQTGTERRFYTSTEQIGSINFGMISGRHQNHFVFLTSLARGRHQLEARVRYVVPSTATNAKHVWVAERSLVGSISLM